MTERSARYDQGQPDQAAQHYVVNSLAAQDLWLRCTVSQEAALRSRPDLLVLARRLALTQLTAEPPTSYPDGPDKFARSVTVLTYASEIAIFNEAVAREAGYSREELPDGSASVTYSLPEFRGDSTVGVMQTAIQISRAALVTQLAPENGFAGGGVPTTEPLQQTVAGIVSAAGVRPGHVPEWLPLDSASLAPHRTLARMDEHALDIMLGRAEVHDVVRFVGGRPEPPQLDQS